MKKIGEIIKQRRELLGLIQSDLGSVANVSVRTIQLIEQGKGNPSLKTLLCIIDPLGLELDFILKIPQKSALS